MANCELAKKIVAVMSECHNVEKKSFNNKQGYKYASAAALVSMVNDALTKNNIATLAETELLKKDIVTGAEGKTSNYASVKITVTLIDADSGETAKISGVGDGWDSLDKAVAKAQTQALKYAYMSSFAIAQGDDPDDDRNYFEPTPAPGYQNGNSNGNSNWSGDGKNIVGQCEECGKDVNEKSAYYSKKNFNKLLCYNCQQKHKAS